MNRIVSNCETVQRSAGLGLAVPVRRTRRITLSQSTAASLIEMIDERLDAPAGLKLTILIEDLDTVALDPAMRYSIREALERTAREPAKIRIVETTGPAPGCE